MDVKRDEKVKTRYKKILRMHSELGQGHFQKVLCLRLLIVCLQF